ncbi:electron transfer flavoprotein subunit beta/FixA family protein [Lysinibacillus sp. BW-2-10]|uniref:electron transfer flavoprotein subunit beta/FixA family protein n=1 Tax=Lysinibacillus sp. BW-2-10 TaxID=2590030 RepID=UPI00117FBD74|nr:electron transfer flavoprotein subunit beta/FixA family protein [Lysinibacillus sp. BW-2-10]TSI09307.1 electron transfer flavoprotein subunit beta/FixA family protein [Lysinibacillus sp. BW-2-10]
MNIIVILKQTFDTEEKISIKDGQINESGVKYIINPYDEYALEEAIQLKEQFGGEVTVISIGPDRVESSLRVGLAIGVDKAILVDDESLFGDEFTTSKVLAAIIKDLSYDIILGGNMSVDNGSGQVAQRLAEELDIAHVGTATSLKINEGEAIVERDAEGNTEIIKAPLPLLVTAQQGLNEPRYPSLPGIMKAKKKPIEHISATDLGINLEEIKQQTMVTDLFLPPTKQAGKILAGEITDQAKELVQLLRVEAKVI